ncbi:MAG TPA: ATP-binding protein [Thermoanaerobaculia bacterium]
MPDIVLLRIVLVLLAFSGVAVALHVIRVMRTRRRHMRDTMQMLREANAKLREQSAELVEAQSHAEEASAAKSEFLAHMSHEMRTPLHGVIGMLQLAIDDENSPRRARQLDMARRSAESLLATIEDILDFSKIEARRIELEPVYFSIRDLVNETVKPLGVTAATKGLVLSAGVAPNVPDSVWGDPVRIRQIIVNLIGNAIKFTDSGEVSLRVSAAGDRVLFEVRDTGIGIPEGQRETIFQPFAQGGDSRTRAGTGLGLAIVARLVDAMDGHLDLQSETGAGTTISIGLPLASDSFASGTRRPRRDLAGRSALLVEPNATSRAFITEMLASAGLEVIACASVAEIVPRRYACAISADESIAIEPAIIITSPLSSVSDERIRVTRPVAERELLEAIGTALGLNAKRTTAPLMRQRVNAAGLHVLVAEDEIVSQEFAAEALRRLMHHVTLVSDGAEALERLAHENFDLVFMDVQMPRIDGLEATRRFRETEKGRRTPVIALTAHSRRDDRARCLEAGMDAVLTKPIDLRKLEEMVRSFTAAEPIVNAVGGNVKLLERVRTAFAKQTPALLLQIRDAIDKKDSGALYQGAHKIKGAVSNFEGDPSFDLSVLLETAARESDFGRAATLLRRLEPAVNALEQRISAAVSYSSANATPSSTLLR